MADATTGGYSQSVGAVTMNGSWANRIGPISASFEWGYGSFAEETSSVDSSEDAASYSRTPSVDLDVTIKFRAKVIDGVFTSRGSSSGNFKTYANDATFLSAAIPGAPGITTCPVTGNVIPNTVESVGDVFLEFSLAGTGGWSNAGSAASGISGGGTTALALTLSGLAPNTAYDVRWRITRTTENAQTHYSPVGTFTTLASALTFLPGPMLATSVMFSPAINTLVLSPGVMASVGAMLLPKVSTLEPVLILPEPMESIAEMLRPTVIAVLVGTFEDFIRAADRAEIVLAEVTPSLTVRDWTSAGAPYTSTYKTPVARLYLPDVFSGGVYRRVVGVRENATDLTPRASIAATAAAASSWYWDEAAGQIYVRSSTGADPSTFVVYQVFVTYFLATTGVVLDATPGDPTSGVYYWPWLSGDLPRVSQYMEDLLLGIKITEGGSLGLTNAHGFFNRAVPDHNWKHKRISLFLGGTYSDKALTRDQYVPIVSMLVDDLAANEEDAAIHMKSPAKLLDIELPITPYFESAYPNLGEGVRGTKKRLGWGRGVVAPDLTDTSGFGVWTVADAAYQTLTSVHTVWAALKTTGVLTQLTEGTHYTVSLSACTITVTSGTYLWQSYSLVVDVTGLPLATFSSIVRDILQRFLGVADVDLDLPSFVAAESDAPQPLALWIAKERALTSILATTERGFPSLERSVMGNLHYTPEGKWRVKIFEPSPDLDLAPSLRKEDFAAFSPSPRLETVFSSVRVHYGYDHAADEWSVEQIEDLAVKYVSETNDRLDLYTFLTATGDAAILATRAQLLAGASPMEVEFEERGVLLAQARPGDFVRVTFDPMPIPGYAADSRAFEIVRLDRALDPLLTISGRLADLRGIVESVGRWTVDGAPIWALATADERESQGFWTDDLGRTDPSDVTTADQSVWW